MKLVRRPLMGPEPAKTLLAVPNVTAHPSTAVLLYHGPLLCSFNVSLKGSFAWVWHTFRAFCSEHTIYLSTLFLSAVQNTVAPRSYWKPLKRVSGEIFRIIIAANHRHNDVTETKLTEKIIYQLNKETNFTEFYLVENMQIYLAFKDLSNEN